MDKIIKWLEANQFTCSWKKYLGFECPGCGIQTAIIELLKGNVYESFLVFPALYPLLFTLFFLLFHLIFKLKKGALILKILFIFTVSILVISYLVKILTH